MVDICCNEHCILVTAEEQYALTLCACVRVDHVTLSDG